MQNTLHHALAPFLVVSRFFGLIPVSGIDQTNDINQVTFRWLSMWVVFAMVLIVLVTLNFLLSINIVVERGLKVYTLGLATLCAASLVGMILLMRLSQNWPNFIRKTTKIEAIFLQKSYETRKSLRFSEKIRRYGTALLIGAAVEYGLGIITAVYNNNHQIQQCNLTINFWENYFLRERLQIFSLIKFRLWMIPLTECTTIAMAFALHFIDILLMLICVGIATRFDQMHQRIQQNVMKYMPDDFWLKMRCDFMSLYDLVVLMDDQLSGFFLLSCTNNLYNICFQVFQCFQIRSNFVEEISFWYSLTFSMTRTLTMMFGAASVNDAANNILSTLYEIPSAFWCLELKRFNEIVASDLISLSGKRFFFLTRRLIFAMAGTVVTYELVLMDQVDDAVDRANYCVSRKIEAHKLY